MSAPVSASVSASDLPTARLVLVVADLAGYHRAFRSRGDAAMAAFLDRFYAVAEDAIGTRGGRILKFMGDALLAIFPEEEASAAVAATLALESGSAALGRELGLDLPLGANLHAGEVVLAELGRGASRRLDVIGAAVNQTFLLGRGAGVRISERVYRRLPSGERSPWTRHRPPAVYVLGGADGP